MPGFMKYTILIMGFTISMTQAGWTQSVPSTASSSHAHEQKCMNVKERSKTGPCPLKDPSNKTIPGVAGRPAPPVEKPAKQPPTKSNQPSY